MPADEHNDDYRERLKSALWYAVGKMVDNESLTLQLNATPQFIGALTEMVFAQMENVTKDLESFAHHANRTTISTDDVLLLARRNEDLEGLLKEFVESEKAERDKERGSVAAKGKGKAVSRGKARK